VFAPEFVSPCTRSDGFAFLNAFAWTDARAPGSDERGGSAFSPRRGRSELRLQNAATVTRAMDASLQVF
jgi:hypothetical protein